MLDAATLLKYTAAGGVGSIISHSGAVPLDVIKTRVQLEPEKFAGNGWLQNVKTLVAEEGVGVLLGGLGSTALGYGLHGALKYGGFEYLKYAIFNHGGGVASGSPVALFAADHRLPALMLAGMSAEFVATLVLCPLEQTRIKMVSDPEYADGVVAAVVRLFSEGEGVGGVLASLPVIWTKTVPYAMFQLPVYDVTSSALRDAAAGLAASSVGVVVPPLLTQVPASLVAAVCASLAGTRVYSTLLLSLYSILFYDEKITRLSSTRVHPLFYSQAGDVTRVYLSPRYHTTVVTACTPQ